MEPCGAGLWKVRSFGLLLVLLQVLILASWIIICILLMLSTRWLANRCGVIRVGRWLSDWGVGIVSFHLDGWEAMGRFRFYW